MTVESLISGLLEELGKDPDSEGLKDTPRRVAAFWREWLDHEPPKLTTFDSQGFHEMIIQTGIPFYSMCEHHMLPFFGVATVAYIPVDRIIGLSKITRIVQHHARDLTTQEYLTHKICEELETQLAPQGIAVSLAGRHLCMEMRGVKSPAVTVTNFLSGSFMHDQSTRAEFLKYVKTEL